MDRALPEFNRVLHKKWLTQNKRLHRQKILETRPMVDNQIPESYRHPIVKSKREQLIEGTIFLIVKNAILREMH